jgi:hypothetical protein
VPVVVTAPHTLEVLRDGERFHKMESYTGTLSTRMARACGGGYVTWSEAERARVRAVTDGSGAPDASNRDPNHLLDEELAGSPWFAALVAASAAAAGPAARLHVDLHGMNGSHGADCILGTAAMERRRGRDAAERFRAALGEALGPLLAEHSFVLSFGPDLQGDKYRWGEGRNNTLTQMSTDPDLWDVHSPLPPFTHAVQVEMTLPLRKLLDRNKAARDAFARGLYDAFQRSLTVPVSSL